MVASHRNQSFLKLKGKLGGTETTLQQFRQATHEEKSVRFKKKKKGFNVKRNAPEKFDYGIDASQWKFFKIV